MIDQETIDRIFSAADIVDVISEFVNLKRSGANYKGLSPFTNEKTPSFMVSPSKQIYKCFSSDKGGNAVGFLMEHEKFSYPEALRYLAKKYNIEIVEKEKTAEDIQRDTERESMMIVTSHARKYFSDILTRHEEGKAIGLSYFKERGFLETVIEKFELGYCLEKKDAYTQSALKAGYKIEFLVKTGLTIQKDDFQFDRFHGRVIFPIHSLSGKVIGFGGRTLKKDDKMAKYLNSPESEIYHKSRELYGLYFAKKEIVKTDRCYLVEGYTDVLSMHQNGIENVVASSGTALTTEQIRLVKRFTNNITIIYDGDEAGIKASLRGIDLVLEEGMNVKVLLLPDGEDPDSFSRKNSASEFMTYIKEQQQDFISFKTKLLLDETVNDPVGRANLIQDIVRSIAAIPERIIRSVYIRECSSLLKVDEQMLYSEVYSIRREKAEKSFKRARGAGEVTLKSTTVPSFVNEIFTEPLEKKLVRYLLLYPDMELFEVDEGEYITVAEYIINEILNDEHNFSNLVYETIFKEYQQALIDGKLLSIQYFVNNQDANISKVSVDLISQNYEMSKVHERKGIHLETEEQQLTKLIPKDIINYKRMILEMARKNLLQDVKNVTNTENFEKVTELQKRFSIIGEALNQLSKEQGWVIL